MNRIKFASPIKPDDKIKMQIVIPTDDPAVVRAMDFDPVRYAIAEDMKKFRKQNKMTQGEFADRVGISRMYVLRLEQCRYNMTLKTLFAISMVMPIDFDKYQRIYREGE